MHCATGDWELQITRLLSELYSNQSPRCQSSWQSVPSP